MQFLTNLKQLALLLAGTLVLFPVAAQSKDPAAIKINLNISNSPLETALAEIRRQSGMNFFYGEDIEKYASKRVSITENGISVDDALTRTLNGTDLRYRMEGGRVIIQQQVSSASPQSQQRQTGRGSVNGSVLDGAGQPIVGATVTVPGTGIGTMAGAGGKYTISNIPAGTTTLKFSFMGHETQEVTGISVAAGRSTPLDVQLRESANKIDEVVVTGSYNQANTAGVLAMQKSMAQVASVISAQQIGRTADKNLGETLKRVTGISTMDNKYVVVRGMGERWNEASLDGVTLPSTETNNKAFSFDLIPTNIIDNVAVVKSPTPDMNASFAGGFVQITTKAIPAENFFNISLGGTWNSASTGKEQWGRERGKLDWLGFDDGRRTFPTGTTWINMNYFDDQRLAQSYTFKDMGDNFSLHKSRTPLAGNVQFSVGRVWNPRKRPEDRLGFVGSVSYRNTQQQTLIDHQGRGSWANYIEEPADGISGDLIPIPNKGNIYKYGTVLSGLLNGGWERGTSRVNFRNMYTRKYDNDLHVVTGWGRGEPYPETVPPVQDHFNSPTFQDLLQNKLDGERQLGKVKLKWELSHTYVRRNQKDAVDSKSNARYIDGETFFDQIRLNAGAGSPTTGVKRRHYDSKERDFNWGLSAELPFEIGDRFKTTAKAGYMGANKNNSFLFEEAEYYYDASMDNSPGTSSDFTSNHSLKDQLNPFLMGAYGYYWFVDMFAGGGNTYRGTVTQHSPYVMFDHRWDDVVRLVWGARAEYYLYDEKSNPFVSRFGAGGDSFGSDYMNISGVDKPWQWMPSANLTVTPFNNFNIRLSYARSMIRPQFMERTKFDMYDPVLSGYSNSRGVISTTVDGADLKIEWFPGAGEIISAGAFYRYLKDPIERTKRDIYDSGIPSYTLENSAWARNWGFEFELRKNFGFIYDHPVLNNLYLAGNATITQSEVVSLKYVGNSQTHTYETEEVKQHRPLYGQTPLIANLALSYEDERLGLNLAVNYTGRKVAMLAEEKYFYQMEFEAASTLLDAQISWTFPRQGVTLKLSASNLLDTPVIFYNNYSGDFVESENGGPGDKLKPGKNEGYDKHDIIEYKTRSGRSVSFSASWTF